MVDRGPGGTTFQIGEARLSPPMSAVSIPFQCTLVPQYGGDGSPAGNKVRVEYFSRLFVSLIPLVAWEGITGLYDPSSSSPVMLDLDGPDNTVGYTSPDGVPDDYVFFEIKFATDGVTISTAGITTAGNDSNIDPTYDPWDDSGDALLACDTSTPPVQTYARIVLSTYRDGALEQDVRNHLVLKTKCFAGRSGLYPVPY